MKFVIIVSALLICSGLTLHVKKTANLRASANDKINADSPISRFYTNNCYQQTSKAACLDSMSINGDYGLVNKCAYCDNLYCVPVDVNT